MSKHPLLLGLTLLSASLFTGQAFADRTVTDPDALDAVLDADWVISDPGRGSRV